MFYAPASGGVRTYLDAKSRWLGRHGIRHTLVIPAEAQGVEERPHGTRVLRVKSPALPFTPGYRLFIAPFQLEEAVARERPDIIEVGSPFVAPLLTRWAARYTGCPIVGFYHADLHRTYVEPYVRKAPEPVRNALRQGTESFVRRVYNGFSATLAASPSVIADLETIGVERLRYVPLGVDTALFTPGRRTMALRSVARVETGVPVGVFAGRMCPEKEIEVVLEAHRLIAPERRPHLVFIGDGPGRPRLEEWARTNERVTVLPFQHDRERLAEFLAGADFYIASGPGETFGLSIAEALASGQPVVGVQSGAVPDRTRGFEGCRLYERGDVDQCRGALEAMELATPRRTSRIRSRAELHLGWDQTFVALERVYRELLEPVEQLGKAS